MRARAAMGVAAAATLTSWLVTGRVLDHNARQDLADRWAEAELCLLGPGLHSGARPSARLRAIELGGEAADWPARCEPAAAALDRALDRARAAPALGGEVVLVPRLEPALAAPDRAQRDRGIDALWAALRKLHLPAGRPSPVVEAPAVARAPLSLADLSPIATGAGLDDLALDRAQQDGGLRWISASQGRLCRIEPGAPTFACERPMPPSAANQGLATANGAALFAWQRRGAAALLLGEGGVRDAATGAPIWRAGSDFDALSDDNGAVVLYRMPRTRAEAPDGAELRLARLPRGKLPQRLRLDLPTGARAALLPGAIAWWLPGEAVVRTAAIANGRLERAQALSPWRGDGPAIDRCFAGKTAAAAFAAPGATAILFWADGWRLRAGTADAALDCQPDAVSWLGGKGRTRRGERCTAASCRAFSVELPAATLIAVAPLGDRVAAVWGEPDGPLYAWVGPAGAAPKGELLLDDADHGGVAARKLRVVSSAGRALALIEDVHRRVFAIALGVAGVAAIAPAVP